MNVARLYKSDDEPMVANIEHKDCNFELKEVSDDGVFHGYGSVFNNVDSDRDVIVEGAFTKTINKKGASGIALLWQHDPADPIGVWEEMVEDSKGLRVRGRLLINQNIPNADRAYSLLKAKAVSGLSVGFAVPNPNKNVEWDDQKGVRRIKEVDLWETSVVTFPANTRARISRVKSAMEDKVFVREILQHVFADCETRKDFCNVLLDGGFSRKAAKQIAAGFIDLQGLPDDDMEPEAIETVKSSLASLNQFLSEMRN